MCHLMKKHRRLILILLVVLVVFQFASILIFSNAISAFHDDSWGETRHVEVPKCNCSLIVPGVLDTKDGDNFYEKDPEGPLLEDIKQLLLTVSLNSMLDIGCSLSGHMSLIFGPMFNRVVVLSTDLSELMALKANLIHSQAEFVHSEFSAFGKTSPEKFDVVFLNMVLQTLPTYEVAPTLQLLQALLKDEGVAIVTTTYVEEGHGTFHLSTGETVNVEKFNTLTNPATGITRFRRWTKSDIMQSLGSKLWEVTSHVLFTYGTSNYSSLAWEKQEKSLNRSFQDVRTVPLAQMVAVRRLATHDSSKFAEPVEPSSPSVKSVVFSLVRGGADRVDFDDLVESRKCLRSALHQSESADDAVIDEVLFLEGSVPDHVQKLVTQDLPGIRFVDVRLYAGFGGHGGGSGGGIYRWKPWNRLRRPHEYAVGYRHMCRFMAMLWMHALSRYQYAMRVDDDVCIHKMLHPFKFLREAQADYAYGLEIDERHLETVDTLTPWFSKYVASRGLVPRVPHNVSLMYFTNFFVTNVSWWLSNPVRLFMHTVDRSGNIYNHRWGDAPLQTAALHLFAAPRRIQWLHVDYSHTSTSNEIRNGSEVALPELSSTTTTRGTTLTPPLIIALKYMEDWNVYIAPCKVANHFNLINNRTKQSMPLGSYLFAVQALKDALRKRATAENINVDDYSPIDLAYAVQVDLYNSTEPLPPEELQGAARKNAMVRLASGKDRQHREYKDFTFDEWSTVISSPCFGMQNFFAQFNKQSKGMSGVSTALFQSRSGPFFRRR